VETAQVGKNDPCPCNSGKKYRQCCWVKRFDRNKPKPSLLGDGASTTRVAPRPTSPKSKIRVGMDYRFSDGIGIGQVGYCFDVSQKFLLTSGLVVTADKIEVGMQFYLEAGMVATVTKVVPSRAYPPPPPGKDANGNSLKNVVGTVKYTGYYPVIDLIVGDQYIKTTPGHRFYSLDRGGWVEAESLEVGEHVATENRRSKPVTAVSAYRIEYIELYNVEVEDFHTYFVGTDESAVWSHNGLDGGCAIPKPARTESGKLASKAGMSVDPLYAAGWEAIFGGQANAVRKTLNGRLPKEGSKGSWNGATPGEGVWRSTDPQVRKAAAKPGEPIPAYVDIEFKNGFPVFNSHTKTLHGIKGETNVVLDVDPKAALRTRADRDFAAANEWLAGEFNKARVKHPEGGSWTGPRVQAHLDDLYWQWHHHENMTTMALMDRNLHDNIPHLGGRSLKDFSFDPPLPKRKPK
jgi:hypothetical protein